MKEIIDNVKPLTDEPGLPFVYEDEEEKRLGLATIDTLKRHNALPKITSDISMGIALATIQSKCNHGQHETITFTDPGGNEHQFCKNCLFMKE